MWGITTKKIGRVAVKEQGKSGTLLFNRSLANKSSRKQAFSFGRTYSAIILSLNDPYS
jgi:hypothetical protein